MIVTMPDACSAFSWMTMVSATCGTGAPVKMRTASPRPTLPLKPAPAADCPTSLRVAGSAAMSSARTA